MSIQSELEFFFQESQLAFIRVVPFEKIIFDSRCEFLCKYGCKNYRRKYCCPPDSLQITEMLLKRKYKWALLAATSAQLPEKVSVYKKRFLNRQKEFEIQKISTSLRDFFNENNIDHLVLSGGSCKKCQKCSKIDNQECKKPDLKLTSMEAVGIDCQKTLTSAGFDFEMPAQNSVNRCTAVLFDFDGLSSICWKKNPSYQHFKKIGKKNIKLTCDQLLSENPRLFESIELMPISNIKQGADICNGNCIRYSKNFSCPPYATTFNFNLWNQCVLWKWKENDKKTFRYNLALKKIHTTLFSMGLYFALSIRDCYCDECSSCEYKVSDNPICNNRKIMSPSMQSQKISPYQFGEGKFGLELI